MFFPSQFLQGSRYQAHPNTAIFFLTLPYCFDTYLSVKQECINLLTATSLLVTPKSLATTFKFQANVGSYQIKTMPTSRLHPVLASPPPPANRKRWKLISEKMETDTKLDSFTLNLSVLFFKKSTAEHQMVSTATTNF
jgi:hypothetical protein